ncbi:hypothetical protein [Chitinophaga sancti]|uniref:Uncharacterized protein n=1 Tax=Chitinophaga sancti TaxID=1004 RepID=A0A1K1SBM3_9BACT|nr:hypothetical protein [Chitinophaga sancti]WQD63568.1 hypothetical protein U0033_04110 [Chitinophaga sancti]WQG90806.1 hypothetical protein SR876_04805 [Chitinophaga sancti]SFW81769.1 hypothetical protein SAMN05661012_05139 [Chitinophaga sancti]
MEEVAIKEFISIYQYVIFSQLRAIFDSPEPPYKEGFPDSLIRYKRVSTDGNASWGMIAELLENSNLSEMPQVLSEFFFIKPFCIKDRFVLFGRDNGLFKMGLDLVTRKVILYDEMEGEYTYIADSESGFLDYLRIYLEYRLMPNEIKFDEKVNLMFKEKVIAAVGGDEYKDYYRFVFPTKKDSENTLIVFPFKL